MADVAGAATTAAASAASSTVAPEDGGAADAGPAYGLPTVIDSTRAREILLYQNLLPKALGCEASSDAEQIRCMLRKRFDRDDKAQQIVLQLYERTGSVVGLEPAQQFDGGWRGTIELLPELPVGRYRRHLQWVAEANEGFDRFFKELGKHGSSPLRYGYQPLALKFFRSVGRTTPSAFANQWAMSYNVSGSLHSTADAVRETFFHEIYHFNDRAHGNWSERALSEHVDPIVEKCSIGRGKRLSTPCLAPYAPNHTTVRGGTYYAFQPGNGVWEYAAELAVRYYREHRVILGMQKTGDRKAFKCGPEPNPTTWKLLADEFFGGVDLVPPCP